MGRLLEKSKRWLRSGFVIAGLSLCLCGSAFSQPVGQSPTDQPTSIQMPQWKQSIERPNRAWDYNGQQILGRLGHDVCLWDIKTGELLQQMKEHQEQIWSVQFGSAGQHALSSSWASPGPIGYQSKDTRTILWNLTKGQELHSLKGQVAGEFSPDGKRLVTFSQRPGKLSRFDAAVWEVDTGRLLVNVKLDDENEDPYWGSLHFSLDGRRVVRNTTSATFIYSAGDGHEIARINTKMSHRSRYTSHGKFVSFDSKKFELFDTAKTDQVIKSTEHGLGPVGGHNAVWTHDGSKVVAVPTREEVIEIWDVKSGEKTIGAKVGPYPKQVAIISPDNDRLAVEWGGANQVEPEFGLYDMSTGKEVARIKLAGQTHLLGFAPDSKTLLVGCPDRLRSSDDQEKPASLAEFSIYDAKDGKKINSVNLQRPSP